MTFLNKSIKRILFSHFFLILVLLSILFLISGIFLVYNLQKKEIKIIEENTLFSEKQLVKNQVENIYDFIKYEKEKSPNLPEEIKQQYILKLIERIRFNHNGYIFINKFNGDALIYDGKIVKKHKNIYNLTDNNGVEIFKLELNAAKKPKGDFIEYSFKKMGADEKPEHKISYIKALPEWKWIIGAGVYKSDISEKIKKQKIITNKTIVNELLILIIIIIVFIIIVYYVIALFSKKIEKELNIFLSFFKNASHKYKLINKEKLKYKEFKKLADYANIIIAEEKKSKDKILHINNILKDIQSLNELIIKVKDKKIFAQGVCDSLIKTGGYKSSWLALLDKNREFEFLANAGLYDNGSLLLNDFKNNKFNKCFKEALKTSELILIKDVEKECRGCPLLGKEPENRAYTIRLEYSGIIYGILSVSVPAIYFDDKDEQNLFKKLSADLSFILYNLEIENKNKEAELALIASEKKYRTLFERVSNVAVFGFNKDLEVTFWNKASEQIFGYSKEEAIGNTLDKLIFPAQKKSEYINNVNNFLKNGTYPPYNEREVRHKNGKQVSIILNYFLFKNPDDEPEIFNFAVDISKRKEYEEALKKSEQELLESNATKDKFFSIIGHDIRSPFNSIIGFADIIRNDVDSLDAAQIEKIGESIYNTGNTTLELINNLIEWSRTQTGRIECKPEKFFIKSIIGKTYNLLKNNIEKKSINFIIDVSDETRIYADVTMFEIILRNLISNAIKFSFQNGTIKIKAEEDKALIKISIEDSGIGIKKEDLDKLFNNNIIHTTRGTNNEKGTGLGLILCKELVEMNNGKIWAESEYGKGCKFIFTLPVD